MAKRSTFSDQLRQAIRQSGQSLYEIAKRVEVDNGVLYRFMSGERGLTTKTVDRLCAYLGLELRRRPGKDGGR